MEVRDLDPHSAAVQQCPFPWYALLRRESPVHLEPHTGWWFVTAYEDVATALRRPDVFSSRVGEFLRPTPEPDLAAEISDRLEIPTIGIGAGPHCDGQVLVYHDLLGLEERIAPRFVRRYAELGLASREAVARFAEDVRAGRFPAKEESYGAARPEEAMGKLYG